VKGNGLSLTRADMSCARGGQPVSGPEFGHTCSRIRTRTAKHSDSDVGLAYCHSENLKGLGRRRSRLLTCRCQFGICLERLKRTTKNLRTDNCAYTTNLACTAIYTQQMHKVSPTRFGTPWVPSSGILHSS
jgi:hypothetical protein